MKCLRISIFLTFAAIAFGQPGTPYDCFSVYTFSAATSQTGQNNSSSAAPCVAWRVTYTSTGFSSVTVQFETSPDNTNWTAVTNSICSSSVQPPCVTDGSNPLAADVMGSSSFRAYGKYVRIHITGVTGTGSGQVVTYGYRGTSASALAFGSGGGGGGATATVSSSSYATFAMGCAAAVSGSIGLLVDKAWTGLTTQTCNANPIQFISSGSLKPAAAGVVTLSGNVQSGLYQIFDTSTGGAGSIVIGANTPSIYAEWFGAKGDGTTNDTVAIQAAISATFSTVQLLAKSYAFTSGLTITHNGETLAGTAIGQLTPYLGTTLTTSTTTGDSIKLSGGGAGECDGAGINAVTLRDFNIVHTAAQTVNASIDVEHGCLDNISNIYTYDSFIGIYAASSTLLTIEHTHHYFPTDSSSSRYGIQLDGSTGAHSVDSIYINFNTVTGGGSNHITGLYLGPGNVGDVYVNTFEPGIVDYGIQIHPTTCTNTACNENIRINRLIADQNLVAGLYINNLTAVGSFIRPSVTVTDIYVDSNVDNGIGIDLNNGTQGVIVNGGTLSALSTANGTIGVSVVDSNQNNISNVIFYGWKTAMELHGSGGATHNTINGNLFNSKTGQASTTYINMGSNADVNILTNNEFAGFYTTGIAFASDALANIAFPNMWDISNATNAVTQGAGSWGNVVTGPGGTPPTLSGACSATIGTNSTNAAGSITTTTTGSCAITLTFEKVVMGTAGNAWSCQFSNLTTANLFRQTGSLSTTAASGVGVTISGDVISYLCAAY
jgi:hypothetical protein